MAIGSIIGGLYSAYSSNKAAGDIQGAANMSAAEQRRQFDLMRDDTRPYRQTGENALYEMSNMLGLGGPEYYETQNEARRLRDRLENTREYKREFTGVGDYEQVDSKAGMMYRNTETGQMLTRDQYADRLGQGEQERIENPEYIELENELSQVEQELSGMDPQASASQFDLSQTPGYQFRFNEGMNALDQSLAATGNRFSGRAAKAAQRYGQGLASQEFSNRFNRLASLSGRGQSAVETSGQAGMQAAGNIGNAMMAGGRASAAGTAGVNQAIQGGIGNYMSYQQNQNLLNQLGNDQYRGGANNYGGSYGTGTGSSPVAAYGR